MGIQHKPTWKEITGAQTFGDSMHLLNVRLGIGRLPEEGKRLSGVDPVWTKQTAATVGECVRDGIKYGFYASTMPAVLAGASAIATGGTSLVFGIAAAASVIPGIKLIDAAATRNNRNGWLLENPDSIPTVTASVDAMEHEECEADKAQQEIIRLGALVQDALDGWFSTITEIPVLDEKGNAVMRNGAPVTKQSIDRKVRATHGEFLPDSTILFELSVRRGFKAKAISDLADDFARDLRLGAGDQVRIVPNIGDGKIGLYIGSPAAVNIGSAATDGRWVDIWFGDTTSGKKINWYPTDTGKTLNPNIGIIGTMGTGKTQFVKSVIMQMSKSAKKNGGDIGVLIFDYKSDYVPQSKGDGTVDSSFVDAVGAKYYKLHNLPYNPLALFGDSPLLPIRTASAFTETMGKAFRLGEKQRLRLQYAIEKAYAKAGIIAALPKTWTRTAPTIENVWDVFLEDDPPMDSLYAALSKLVSLQVFDSKPDNLQTLYDLIDSDGVSIIDLAGDDPSLQNLVVALTLDLFYSQMQRKGKPTVKGDFRQVTKMILVDEADNFMSQDFPSLRKVLKEGREYGVGTALSTQQITHFKTGENNYADYMKSWVIHAVDKIDNADIKSVFNVDNKTEQNKLMNKIRNLPKHHSIYVTSDKRLVEMRDRAFWEWSKEEIRGLAA